MVNDKMGVLGSKPLIGAKLIGHQPRTSIDVFANDGMHFVLFPLVTENLGFDFSATLQHSHDHGLCGVLSGFLHTGATLGMHVASLATDKGFVNLYLCGRAMSGGPTELATVFVLNRKTKP